MKLFHVLDSGIFTHDWLTQEFFPLVDEMKKSAQAKALEPILTGKRMVGIFHRPSLQTRFAAESAMLYLGGKASIVEKQVRPFIDDVTIIVNDCQPDILIVRSDKEGGAREAVAVSLDIPVVNCGEEFGDHPPQALTDAYTIWQKLGRLENLTIAIAGELNRIGAARYRIFPVDSDPRAVYFEQVKNSQYVWMALLKLILAP